MSYKRSKNYYPYYNNSKRYEPQLDFANDNEVVYAGRNNNRNNYHSNSSFNNNYKNSYNANNNRAFVKSQPPAREEIYVLELEGGKYYIGKSANVVCFILF